MQSFASIESWMAEFLQYGNPRQPDTFPFVVVGNKMDLEDQREVDSQAVRELLEKHPGLKHFQASAKDKSGVNEVFERTALAALEGRPEEMYLWGDAECSTSTR
jgi:Ras-related protein Rab-7A